MQLNDKSYETLTVGSLKVLGNLESGALHSINTQLEKTGALQMQLKGQLERFYEAAGQDGIITAFEKRMLKKEMTVIETEYPVIVDGAEKAKKKDFDVTVYKKAFKNLCGYIYRDLKLFNEMDKSLEVDGKRFNKVFAEYYKKRSVLQISKDGKSLSFPKDKKAFFYFKFDDKKQTVPKPDKSYSAWQNRIIEFDCSQGAQVDVNFKQALNNIIILTGELKNDFVLNLYFDKENGNGAKQYVIVYKLTGSFSVTVKTPIQNVSKIIQNINDKTYGLCAYVVVDFKGNVWQFKGETGGTGPDFAVREIAAAINERDYFLIEQEKRIKKVEKEAAFFAIQKNDSPIGEVKTFYENDYKHGFLEANGLPFSPQVFPEFKDYCKRIFNTGTDAITGWPLRPKIERTDGTKVFLKAVQGV